MSGDQLAIRLFLVGVALAFAMEGISAAGWNNPYLIYGLFISAGATFLCALFWQSISRRVGLLAKLNAVLERSVGWRFLVWVLTICALVSASYLAAEVAAKGHSNPPAEARKPALKLPVDFDTPLYRRFESDFPKGMKIEVVGEAANSKGHKTKIVIRRVLDFDAGIKFVAFYVPPIEDIYDLAAYIAGHVQEFLDPSTGVVTASRRDPGDSNSMSSRKFIFTKVVYLYSESDLDIQDKARLDSYFRSKGLTLQFRSTDYGYGGSAKPAGETAP